MPRRSPPLSDRVAPAPRGAATCACAGTAGAGLLSVCIPAPVLGLWTTEEFSVAVSGAAEVDVEEMRKQTSFSGAHMRMRVKQQDPLSA